MWPSGRTAFINDPRLHTDLQGRSCNLCSSGAAVIKQLVPALVRYTICSAIALNNMRSSPEHTLLLLLPQLTPTLSEFAGYVSSHLDLPNLMGPIIIHQ
jgi:hypothetical protein